MRPAENGINAQEPKTSAAQVVSVRVQPTIQPPAPTPLVGRCKAVALQMLGIRSPPVAHMAPAIAVARRLLMAKPGQVSAPSTLKLIVFMNNALFFEQVMFLQNKM